MVWLMDWGMKLKESRQFPKRFLGNILLVFPRSYAAWLVWKTEKNTDQRDIL